MPHFIDTRIMRELQATFPEEYRLTSSHRFRESGDMQMAFAYMYFTRYYWEPFDMRRGKAHSALHMPSYEGKTQ